MARRLRAVLSLGLLLFCARAGDVGAYPTPVDFDGSILRWAIGPDDGPIYYQIKADREADKSVYGGAVDDSAQLWTDVATSYFTYAPVPDGERAHVTVNIVNAIDGGAYSAGYAIFDEYEGTKPLHCSIFVVVDAAVSFTGVSKTLLHELGHCVGLGHTLIPEAIMSYSLAANGFALDIDDEAAATRLYPADGSKPKLPPGCAAGPAQAGRGGAVALLLLLLLPLALASAPLKFPARRPRQR